MRTYGKRLGLAGAALAMAVAGLVAPPASAALGSVSAVLSNNQVSSSSTYTFFFTTGTASVTSLVVGVPTTVTGFSGVSAAVSTASSCTGSFSSASIGTIAKGTSNFLVGIPLSSAITTSGTCVKIVLSGLTNPSSAGSATSCVADGVAGAAAVTTGNLDLLTCGGSGITGSVVALLSDTAGITLTYVTKALNGVLANLTVSPTLTVSVPASATFTVTPTASGTVSSGSTSTVNVATNAQTFQVQGQVSGSSSALSQIGGSATIPLSFTSGDSGSNPAAACTGSNGTSFGTSGGSTWVALPVNGTSNLTGLTNSTNVVSNYCWKVDMTKPPGDYTATITYLVVPSF